jgi:hypothetical protein
VRVAENAIDFWVERGNFTYNASLDGGQKIDQLEDIKILGAESLNETNYACYLGYELTPKQMTFAYDDELKILTLTPQEASLTFKDIGFIKFGNNETEPNVCDSKGFTYHGEALPDLNNETFSAYKLTPAIGGTILESLYVTALLMDDAGSVNLNITTESDWNSSFTKLFRVPYVQD